MRLERVPALSLFTAPFEGHWWIRTLCEEIQSLMGDVYVTDEEVPRGTFSTYFRVIVRRSYGGNAQLANLYYLHELRHLRGFLRRGPVHTWLQWQRAMGHSELDASLTSECVVHFLIPEAREAFDGSEIWVDRFLRAHEFQWFKGQTDPEEIGKLHERLATVRLRALNAPTHNDFLEWQIANYGQQNMRWYVIWSKIVGCGRHAERPAWRVVEEHMARPDWVERHPDWLTEVSRNLPGPAGVPFPEQAAEFARVYDKSYALYGNGPLYT